MTHYTLLVGSTGGGLPATSFVELTSGTDTFSVPNGYNAIHIQYAVGAGGGGFRGASYDRAGGESAGAGGGSGGYISDKILTVAEGETITYAIGSGGAANNTASDRYNGSSSAGTNTTLSGSTTGSLITLNGGGGASASGGGVAGPLRNNTAGTAGSATIGGTAITSGIFVDSDRSVKNVNTNTSGPVGSFNQSGSGAAGANPGNCGGDNCQIGGGTGGASYDGNVSGGAGSPQGGSTGGTVGTRGSGGGGGGAQYGTEDITAAGAAGGDGEIKYRFLQVI
jgi:hypothetical protein